MKREGIKTVGQMSGYIVARTGWDVQGGRSGEEGRRRRAGLKQDLKLSKCSFDA